MARLLRELLRRPSSSSSSTRFIATLTHQTPTNLSPPLSLHQQILGQTNFDHHGGRLNPSNVGFTETEEIAHFSKLQVYPSFSFGLFLDPVCQSGLAQYQVVRPGGGEMEQPGMMWADSVKKKRKRKMNKHKYKKLRKRLRRKTKT